MALATYIGFYYPNETTPTLTVKLTLSDKRPSRPLDPHIKYNVELSLNDGGKIVTRKHGEERNSYDLKFSRIGSVLIAELEAFFDQVDKSWRTFRYKHRDGVYYTVRWMNPFHYRMVGNKYDIDISLEEEL